MRVASLAKRGLTRMLKGMTELHSKLLPRCAWAGADPQMQAYHDEEWGVPEHDGRALWEKLMLDGFQAGLAWVTVLRKRAALREAFADFQPEKVAQFTEADVLRMLDDAAIIRSRAKIESTIRGAQLFLDMQARGESFSTYCWSFTGGQVQLGDGSKMRVTSPESEAMSKDLKRRGFKFVGPVIVYAWMQAVGIVDDHTRGCHRFKAR
jgi:DNA-3-methyladenine glycosylase I